MCDPGKYRGCYLNPETMPYTGLGFGHCSGELHYVPPDPPGLPAGHWECDGHRQAGRELNEDRP